MKILITGVGGFTGSHLSEFLLNQVGRVRKVELHGIDISRDVCKRRDTLAGSLKFHLCDLLDKWRTEEVINKIQPDRIFHLSGLTYDNNRENAGRAFYIVNVLGTINLLEAVLKLRKRPLVHIACSSAEYGLAEETPLREIAPFHPINPYGISKLAQDMVGYQYYKNHGLKIIRTRAFNITGPGEKEIFVCSSLARQIALIERKKQEPIVYVGNLESKRDFVDVRDVVRAYWLALEKGVPGEVYNVCSGRAFSIREILQMLLSMTKQKVAVQEKREQVRKIDIPCQVGSFAKLNKHTGWKPGFSIERTLKDLLKYWREKV